MVRLIPLAALTGPQDVKHAVNFPRSIRATDLPELGDLHLQAYGIGTSQTDTEKPATRISAVFEGAYAPPSPKLLY